MSIQYTDSIAVIDTATTTTTTEKIDISKRQLATVQFLAAAGTTVFTIDASNDGTNWVTGIAFLDSKATATGTSVVSKSVASTTELAYITCGMRYIRVVATVSSGTASAIVHMEG